MKMLMENGWLCKVLTLWVKYMIKVPKKLVIDNTSFWVAFLMFVTRLHTGHLVHSFYILLYKFCHLNKSASTSSCSLLAEFFHKQPPHLRVTTLEVLLRVNSDRHSVQLPGCWWQLPHEKADPGAKGAAKKSCWSMVKSLWGGRTLESRRDITER